ncbi:MAG TPA: cupin domain-containing protein [Solirubrobacteraceae bacterium]|nr:cupin domain-containing protein [Solirubrobacteraceae bacterium]
MSITSPLPTALPAAQRGPRWFFGMLATPRATAAETGGQYSVMEILAPPGLGTPLHVHYNEDEGFYVLEGSVTITVGDELVELGPGQHAFGPRNIPHRFDVGPDGARMLWVLTPGGFEDFVEEASVPAETLTVPPADLAPPEGVEEIVRKYGNELL